LPSKIAMKFRKEHIKGFVNIGACQLYIGLFHNNNLIGVLGFSDDDTINSDILIKADTAISSNKNSIDLLLYVLRTKQVQEILEKKFNRKINTAYSMAFSKNPQINRYRKHATLIKKIKNKNSYNLGYEFVLGGIQTLKSAKALWMQKHKIK